MFAGLVTVSKQMWPILRASVPHMSTMEPASCFWPLPVVYRSVHQTDPASSDPFCSPNPPPSPLSVIVPSPVEVSQLLEARAPVVEVVVVLVPWADGVEWADRAGGWTASLIVEHQQRVIGRSCWVVVCCPQALETETLTGRTSKIFALLCVVSPVCSIRIAFNQNGTRPVIIVLPTI